MKKKYTKALLFLVGATLMMGASGCQLLSPEMSGSGSDSSSIGGESSHEHTYVSAVTVATCEAGGFTLYTCECGDSYKAEYTERLEHTPVLDPAVEADCTQSGLTAGYHCGVCETVIVAQEVVTGGKHIEVTDKAVEATCTTDGLTEGKHCSECGEIIVAQEVVTGGKHIEVTDKAVAATCTTNGLTEGKHCSECGEIIVAKETIPAVGTYHVAVVDEKVAPTCTQTGLTEGMHCYLCGAVIIQQEILPATGHNYAQTVVSPGEGKEGYIQHSCQGCGDSYNTAIAGAVGLAYSVNADNTTCTVTGLGDCAQTEIHIPESLGGYTVTAIADKAFENQAEIIVLTIPNTVKSIGTRAFYGCAGLTEFVLPSSVTSVGTQLFYKSGIKTLYYNTVSAFADNLFGSSSIEHVVFGGSYVPSYVLKNVTCVKSVTMLNSVTRIGDDAFYYCSSLTSVVIPDSVTSIGNYAFYN